MSLVNFSEVRRFHNRQDVLKGVNLSIEPGERLGLVGRNGAGKTTVIRLIMDEEAPDGGQVTRAKGLRLGYLPQDVLSEADQPLLNLVLDTDPEYRRLEKELKETEELLSRESDSQAEIIELAERHGRLLHKFEAMGGWGREAEAKKVLSGLGFGENDFERNLTEFSGGWIMRAILARLLVAKPDLLVLDEPTNHLDIDSLIWLENYLKTSSSALLLVSHDRVFLNNVAQKIIELRKGRADVYVGNYDQFLNEKARRLATETAAFANQQERIRQLEKFIEKNRVRATTARRAQSRVKTLEKMDRLEQPDDAVEAAFNLTLPRGRRGPDLVAELQSVTKRYGSFEVYRDLNLTLQRGDRLALIGPNGRGKSTLAKILVGLTEPTSGLLRIGQNVDIGYFSQFQMEALNPGRTIIEELATVAGHLTQGSLRTVLGGFLFSGDDVFKKVSVLSGGEKSRLVLCKIMMTAPNLLIMDEPTNHLDIPGRQMLEDALEDYEGTMILISHDRHFINKLCDKTGVIENGTLTVHPGNFDDFQRLWLADPQDLSGQKTPRPLEDLVPAAPERPKASGERDKPSPSEENSSSANLSGLENKSARRSKDKNERLQAQAAKKLETQRRRPLEKLLKDTEGRLEEIARRSAALEATLGDPATYQDGQKAKEIALELQNLLAEKTKLESVWEEAALQLES
ncbi:MAG: ABC-F family ATP-binding cassette domain-containing protein [Deltaproteobacteria bacterium]|nr:ABC-F family ATP-binding cassette domain-containing protein [Deltaproteobacteria bacterium]